MVRTRNRIGMVVVLAAIALVGCEGTSPLGTSNCSGAPECFGPIELPPGSRVIDVVRVNATDTPVRLYAMNDPARCCLLQPGERRDRYVYLPPGSRFVPFRAEVEGVEPTEVDCPTDQGGPSEIVYRGPGDLVCQGP